MRKQGFTIIELLVVIAIIALLISIILPALSFVREKNKSLKCAINLRSQGQALTMYVDQYKDYPVEPGFAALRGDIIGPFLDVPLPSSDIKLNPWTCPSDEESWKYNGGYSYAYWPTTYWSWSRLTTQNQYTKYKNLHTLFLYEKNAVYFADLLPWHSGVKNAVYADNSVRIWK